ncbi:MAG TPA: 7-carboxy-7-deazaguanine synthase QueE [Bacteroidales bacterium]|nr:7-carboxy-7-deazaguanine synthase QueE [Bacteroidales bacterium]HPS16748.1 7-carboxy-7-deazaguanine synthase QueE [Bacteroidales bacterium]
MDLLNEGRMLPVMEEFYSLQGEGYHTGKAAYFIRIGGCDVGCSWCDVKESWNAELHPLVDVTQVVKNALTCKADAAVITGGEPMNYNLDFFCNELKKNNIQTFLETSGTQPLSGNWDWICFSPKRNSVIIPGYYNKADELKVIIEDETDFIWAEENAVKMKNKSHLFLQPEWRNRKEMINKIVNYILVNPKWCISLQSHKYMNIP